MRALWALLALFASNGISALVEVHNKEVRPNPRRDQGVPRPPPKLTPTLPCLETEPLIECELEPPAAKNLLDFMPRAGGAKVGGALRKAKDKRTAFNQLPAFQRAVAVNAVSWAAVVGGTMLWSRNKMGSTGGVVQKALVGAIVSSTSVQVASNVLRAVSKKADGASGQKHGISVAAGLKSFRWSYLGVLAVCNLGEFIQGPYIYGIYSKRNNLDMGQISILFLASTISSMVTGLFAGSVLDRYGRRNGCMLWALLNIVQCVLIRSKAVGVLMLGRAMAGAGATLLATSFESWMVTEHHSRGYPSYLLADTFRMATWGVGLVAIASGFVGHASVTRSGMGSLAPFNLAIGVSLMSLTMVTRVWKENYGDRSFSAFHHAREAVGRFISDGRLVMMAVVQVLFESTMIAFIILWVPAMETAAAPETFATGTVFSTMMMSLCGGSSLFNLMTVGLPVRLAFSPEACLVLATGLSMVTLAASSMELSFGKLMLAFLVYEACLGLYFPAMATCRSKYIDDRLRGTIMNLIRVPLNLVAALLIVGPLKNSSSSMQDRFATAFRILAGLTGVATVVQVLLLQREREAGIAFRVPGPMASLVHVSVDRKDRRAREVRTQSGGPPRAEGGWSFFTVPEVEVGNTVASATARRHPIADADAAARMNGALAGWMMVSAPSSTKGAANIETTSMPAASPRAGRRTSPVRSSDSSSKLSRRQSEMLKSVRSKAIPAAFLAMTNATRGNEWTTHSPTRVSPSAARSASGSASAAASPSPSSSPSTASASPSASWGLSTKNKETKAKDTTVASSLSVPKEQISDIKNSKGKGNKKNNIIDAPAKAWSSPKPNDTFSKSDPRDGDGHGDGHGGRGKAAAFMSSVAGGVAATAWFLARAGLPSAASSAQLPAVSHTREWWPSPFDDLHANENESESGDRHPSWSTPKPSRAASKGGDGDGIRVEGRSKTVKGMKGIAREEESNKRLETAHQGQGDAAGVDDNGGAKGDDDPEAGVWVGWGGGCAF